MIFVIGAYWKINQSMLLRHDKDFANKYEVLWEDQRDGSKYFVMFVIRRFVYAVLIIVLPGYRIPTFFQYALIVYLNIVNMAYLLESKPFKH